MYTIYKYTNSIDGKVYIGQTSRTIEDRAGKSGYRYRGCSRFYNAILEYGWDAFIPEVIATAETASEADSLEVYYISLYKSADPEFGYNTSVGGGIMVGPANPMYGKKHSEETKQKQRERKLGENNPMYGSTWTETQREKSGPRGMHLNFSEEQREAMRQRMRHVGKTVGLRPVICIEDNTYYNSITEAAEAYGVSTSTLCGHIRGCQKTCCGKHFEYAS